MGMEQLFTVATEFQFDVGQAVFNTNALRGSVDQLSGATDSAIGNLNFLANGMITKLGLGSGGLLSVLTRAVQLNQEFSAGSMGFVNSIGSNMRVLTGTIGTFNDQLETSKMLMTNVGDIANKYGLSGNEMAQITQLYAGPLGHAGKLGHNFEGGIDLAKNTMIGGEAMGLNGRFLAEQIAHAISPGGTFGGKAFERLVNTEAFRGAGIKHSQQFSNMSPDNKMNLIIKSMSELGNNAGYLAARLDLISVQFQMIKANVERVLKPIGDALVIPLKLMFKQANAWLGANGAQLGKNIGDLLSSFISDPEALYVNIKQFQSFGKDLKSSVSWATNLATLAWGLQLLGKVVPQAGGIGKYLGEFLGVGGGVNIIGILTSGGTAFEIFGALLGGVVASVAAFLPIIGALLFIFQAISRARAIAQIHDLKETINIMPRFSAVILRLKNAFADVMLPLTMIMDGFAHFLAPLFETSIWLDVGVAALEKFAVVLEWFGNKVVKMMATLSGMSTVDGYQALKDIGGKGFFESLKGSFNEGYGDFMTRHGQGAKQPTSQPHVENNIKVDARFDMREQLEPDRIAFAVTTHLKKLVIDKTQAAGFSLYTGYNNRAAMPQGG